jgi:HAT1-interacting factor 1
LPLELGPLITFLTASGSGGGTNAPILSFSGDAEDMDDGEDHPVDLFGQTAAVEEVEAEESDEEDDGEPEDDFNAAWEVLDLARAIYDKQKNENDDEEVRLKLADTYIALGDVSLETGLFTPTLFDGFLTILFD